jgi:hypothetical protein
VPSRMSTRKKVSVVSSFSIPEEMEKTRWPVDPRLVAFTSSFRIATSVSVSTKGGSKEAHHLTPHRQDGLCCCRVLLIAQLGRRGAGRIGIPPRRGRRRKQFDLKENAPEHRRCLC